MVRLQAAAYACLVFAITMSACLLFDCLDLGRLYRTHVADHAKIPTVHVDIILAMLLVDGARMIDSNAKFLVEMTCQHHVATHILVKKGSVALFEKYNSMKHQMYPQQTCANMIVEDQPREITREPNTLKRLQIARDYQRQLINATMLVNIASTIVVIVDFDLKGFEAKAIVKHARDVYIGNNNVDALCAIGSDQHSGYYDAFATVLLPDTFLFPPDWRKHGTWPEEDASMYWSLGKTPDQIYQWIFEKGNNGTTPVPVRSCFGGIGIYKAKMWFDARCGYSNFTQNDLKYADRFRKRGYPCEHVVMHNCMRRINPNFTVAIHPKLKAIRYD